MSEPAPDSSVQPVKRTGSLLRSSLVFSALTLLSRFLGLARDLVITARLGASISPAADAYNTALSFPNLFRRIFAEGAFSAAFVPSYSRTLEADGQEAADKLATEAMAALALFTLILTLAAQLAMPWLMYVINPGYASDPEKFKLAVLLTQISMPYLPAMALVALLSGVLNSRDRFILSGLAPTLLNVGMLIAVFPQTGVIGAAKAASWGVLGAGIAQFALLWWGARRAGARLRFALPRYTPAVRELVTLAIPGALAASVTQINIFVSGILASGVAGARSWLAVADRLYQLPLGLVGVAIGVALLPRLSRAVQADAMDEARDATDQAIIMAMALTLPAGAALCAIPYFLIDALFVRGAFTPEDARQTALALFHYGWGVPAFVLARILSPVFFARGDTRGPMRAAIVSVVINVVLGIVLFRLIGFAGIAAATSIASWVNVLQMGVGLWRKETYRPRSFVWSRLARLLVASIAMAAVLIAGSFYREHLETALPSWLAVKELLVLLLCAVGFATYPLLAFVTGAITRSDIRSVLTRRGTSAEAIPGDPV